MLYSSIFRSIQIGLSNADFHEYARIGNHPNFYVFSYECDYYILSGMYHYFEWPKGAVKPEYTGEPGEVVGCGVLLNSKDQLAIFFTRNGILMGKQIPIKHPGKFLIPTIQIQDVHVEANFGDDPIRKPFKYDIEKCPGLVFE